MYLFLKDEQGQRFKYQIRFEQLCDSLALSSKLLSMWDELIEKYKIKRLKKVGLVLTDLQPQKSRQLSLFDHATDGYILKKEKRETLSNTLDLLNAKYGKDTVSIGVMPNWIKKYHNGTKIAFSRIPSFEDFNE